MRLQVSKGRRWWILAVLCLSVFLVTVDNTIVNVALPTLSRELGASTSALQWVVDVYALFFAGLMLAAGALGDRLGRKRALQLGLVVFAVASITSAMSSNVQQLVAARALMGIGAAFIFPATLALISSIFTDRREKATAVGIWSGVAGLAIALGPVTGGVLLEHFYWGSLFLVSIPIIIISLAGGAVLVPESRSESQAPFDSVGTLLSLPASGLLIWTVIEAPTHGWISRGTLLGLLGAFTFLAAFAWWERRNVSPLLDVRLFRNARFTSAAVSIAMAFFGLFGFIFLITQYFQAVRGYGVLQAGAATLPFAVVVGTLSPVAIIVMKRTGTKFVVVIGLLLMSSGFTIAGVIGADAEYWGPIVAAMTLMAAGLAFVQGPATDAIVGALKLEQAGAGAAVNDTTREVGGALGVAVLGSLMSSRYQSGIATQWPELGLPPEVITQGQDSIMAAQIVASHLPEELAGGAESAARDAFMNGLHLGSLSAAAFVAVGAVIALAFLPGGEGSGASSAAQGSRLNASRSTE